jgi:hypothetical protein
MRAPMSSDRLKPLSELKSACPQGFPLIANGNIGYEDEEACWVNTNAVDPEAYCKYAIT